jgi:hypothetical protein
MQMKKINGKPLKKFKMKRHLIVTGHNQLLTSFSESLVKPGNSWGRPEERITRNVQG